MSDFGVVVRTRNAARDLAASIASVLVQSALSAEVVVRGSTDGTLDGPLEQV